MSKPIYYLFIVLFITSCSPDEDNYADAVELNGKWSLKSTCGGFTGSCWFPDSVDEDVIEFENTVNYTQRMNGQIVVETTYTIRELDLDLSYRLFEMNFANGNSKRFTLNDNNLQVENGDTWKEYERFSY